MFTERLLLRTLLILLIVAYGAIGRDVFFNRLTNTSGEDFIGAILVYVRLMLCLVSIGTCLLLARSVRPLRVIPLIFLPYILIVFATAAWTEDVKNTLRFCLTLTLMLPAVAMITARLGIKETATTVMFLLGGTLLLSALFAVLLPSIGRHTETDIIQNVHAGRWRGIFGHKNGLGPHAAYGMVLLWLYPQLFGHPIFLWSARISALACLAFAGSATSMVGAATMMVFGGMFLIQRVARRVAFSVIFLGVAVMVAVMLAIVLNSETLFALLGRDETLTGRTLIWQLAWISVAEAPWLGHGYGSFGGTDFAARIVSYYGDIVGPESSYFNIVLETGVLGAIAFFVPVVLSLRFAFDMRARVDDKDRQAYECMILVLMAALVMAVTESTPLMTTSYGGPVTFTCLFSLATHRARSLLMRGADGVSHGPLLTLAQRPRRTGVRWPGRRVM